MNFMAQTLQPVLERLRRAWHNSPLPAFFRWWGSELCALLPPCWRQALLSGTDWYLLIYREDQWLLFHAGKDTPLLRWSAQLEPSIQQAKLQQAWPAVAPEDLRVALCLTETEVLRRRLLLPQAARDNLYQVAAYEMDRQTPFRLEQVYYDIHDLREPIAAGRLQAELVVAPRQQIDTSLAHLSALGLTIDAVDLLTADNQRLGLNMLPAALRPARQHRSRRRNLFLFATALLLLVLSMGQWLHNRKVALANMQAQVTQMRTAAHRVEVLRRQWQDNIVAAGFLTRRKATSPSILALLEELTERIPANTWLGRFVLDDNGQINFLGQSTQAAQLIDVLKGSRLIDEPNFQGSIQRDSLTGKESFYMSAKLRRRNPVAIPKGQTQ